MVFDEEAMMAALAAEVTENYLKHIYRLSLDGGIVKTCRLAAALGCTPASVTEMVKRLAEQGLVEHRPYRGVVLTDSGHHRALLILRRHRLWEVFLQEVLSIAPDEVHAHAERLEHATDEVLADALDTFLGFPGVGPHGHPIPRADGVVEENARTRLRDVPCGSLVEIVQCEDDDRAALALFRALSLLPGARARVRAHDVDAGLLALEISGQAVRLPATEAEAILVRIVH